VVDTRDTVGRRRSFIKDEWFMVLPLIHALVKNAMFLPVFPDLFPDFRKI